MRVFYFKSGEIENHDLSKPVASFTVKTLISIIENSVFEKIETT